MHARTSLRLLAAVCATALGLAACGSDNDTAKVASAVTTTKSTTATTAKPSTTTAAKPPTTTTAKSGVTSSTAKSSTATTVKPTTSTTATEPATVDLHVTPIGEVITNSAGLTLYIDKQDTQGRSSSCYATCATNWEPETTTGAPKAGPGVDAGKLGTIKRTDGFEQVTYDGWPLYHYHEDAKPGDTKGDKVDNEWYAINAAGTTV